MGCSIGTESHYAAFPLSHQRRMMRDSNPRECEPNPLSKLPPPLFTRVLAVCQVRSTAPDSPANREERGQLRRELRRRRRLGDGRPALSGRATLCFSWLVLHLLIGRSRPGVQTGPGGRTLHPKPHPLLRARPWSYEVGCAVWLPEWLPVSRS
jgi:hypothetical protein